MITVKSIKKEFIWDLVTRDSELDAYACSREFQEANAAITDDVLRKEAEGYKVFGIMATKKRPGIYDFYTEALRDQAVAAVSHALLSPIDPELKNDVFTLRIYALNCGLVTSDPFDISRCVKSYEMPLESDQDKTRSELGMRLLYALEQSGQRISVSFTSPDELEPYECGYLSSYDGFDELVNAVVDAVLEWETGRTGGIWY